MHLSRTPLLLENLGLKKAKELLKRGKVSEKRVAYLDSRQNIRFRRSDPRSENPDKKTLDKFGVEPESKGKWPTSASKKHYPSDFGSKTGAW